MTLAAFLLAIIGPLVGRILVALGFSVVTVVGADIAVNAFKPQLISYLSSGPIAALDLAGLAGVWTGLGMIFGAVTFAVSMWGIRKAMSVLGVH